MVKKISLLSMVLILAGFFAIAQNNTANVIQVSQNSNILQVSFILPSFEMIDTSLVYPYTLEENSFVQIDLYNMQGVLIKPFLQLPQQEAGVYYHNFSLSGLPSGMYLLV